jgi:hypothetical protein
LYLFSIPQNINKLLQKKEMPITTVAAFDLGIKNMSLCVAAFDTSGNSDSSNLTEIRRWTNMNLLAAGAESQSLTRCSCGGPASWSAPAPALTLLCKRCAKKSAYLPLDISGSTVAAWRGWAVGHTALLGITDAAARKATKATLMEAASKVRLMPYKAKKAKGVSLQDILAGMETALDSELPVIATADRIRIENQPSEFAPHMKSVQMMLFALITHRLKREFGWTGTVEFANASVKTKGTDAGVGKGAKKSRKDAACAKVAALLSKAAVDSYPGAAAHLTWWQSQAKQDDLADAFLMCVDAGGGGH